MLKGRGVTRRELRKGSGVDIDREHIDEVLGSSEFYIYIVPNKRAKGYEAMKEGLQSSGCDVEFPADALVQPGEQYQAVKISTRGEEIPAASLRRAHSWAHQRNLLHSFFRPMFKPPRPTPLVQRPLEGPISI